mmetsp:Transcript_36868/g.98203  ORF Transcript_36868/g.98203 Transcript_36868/m.98203 type:complete len:234 (-) Transcript_36868:135-836(-)
MQRQKMSQLHDRLPPNLVARAGRGTRRCFQTRQHLFLVSLAREVARSNHDKTNDNRKHHQQQTVTECCKLCWCGSRGFEVNSHRGQQARNAQEKHAPQLRGVQNRIQSGRRVEVRWYISPCLHRDYAHLHGGAPSCKVRDETSGCELLRTKCLPQRHRHHGIRDSKDHRLAPPDAAFPRRRGKERRWPTNLMSRQDVPQPVNEETYRENRTQNEQRPFGLAGPECQAGHCIDT